MNIYSKLSPIAIHRLKQVREQIQKQPELYCHQWALNKTTCGTVCCILGRLCVNAGIPEEQTWSGNAAKLLGLPHEDCLDLFIYPHRLTDEETEIIAYGDSDPLKRSAAGVKIIDAFIERHL